MIRVMLPLSALLLTACGAKSTPPVIFPTLPPLPPSVAEACPPAALLSASSLGTLVLADIELAVAYAECQAKHGSAVKAYNEARERMMRVE